MFKIPYYAIALVGVAFSHQSIAGDCSGGTGGTELNSNQLKTYLNNSTICVTAGEKSQEEHRGADSGTLWDYKKGAVDPVDPTAPIGSWSISNPNKDVTYTYGVNPGYTYTIYNTSGGTPGGVHYYCGAANNEIPIVSRINPFGSACPP